MALKPMAVWFRGWSPDPSGARTVELDTEPERAFSRVLERRVQVGGHPATESQPPQGVGLGPSTPGRVSRRCDRFGRMMDTPSSSSLNVELGDPKMRAIPGLGPPSLRFERFAIRWRGQESA
jgi:hypothetical protein